MLRGGLLFPMEAPATGRTGTHTAPEPVERRDGISPRRGDLWIEGRRIAAVTPPDPPPDWSSEDVQEIDARPLWILPGFVQTHVHLCQTLFRGAAEGRGLYRWLSEVIWPHEAALDFETTGVSAEAGILQLLSGGVTALLDMGTTRHSEAIAQAAARCGIRALFGPALMDRGPEGAGGLLRRPAEFRQEIEELAARWHGFDEGRLRLALCPRFAPSVTEAFLRGLVEEPSFRSFPIHTHGSETRDEVDEVRALTGKSPPEYFASFEHACGRVKLAHAVWLSPEDRGELARSRTAVLHCPGSNLKLGSGLADIAALREEGIVVGLGSDGAACNNRLDPWREMRLAAHIISILHGPEKVSAREILGLATLEGARVLGLEAETGSLRAGKRADLVLVDPEDDWGTLGAAEPGPADWRPESPEDLLVFAGSPALVRETWVDGRAVWRREQEGERKREISRRMRRARTEIERRVAGGG
jgi:5-methylthioadenosine/S-adenosylhomocysteine deaminase